MQRDMVREGVLESKDGELEDMDDDLEDEISMLSSNVIILYHANQGLQMNRSHVHIFTWKQLLQRHISSEIVMSTS
jgi:hypothetical protein